jgi:endonuclease/exonuclease/phosphatase family metal-dependent hydrolase
MRRDRMRLTVATYNTHSGVGLDRRFDAQRIADVVCELRADIVALQELEFRGQQTMLDVIARATGFHAVAGPTFDRTDGAFGNGLVSRWPIASARHLDLAVARREPRRAIDATIQTPGVAIRVVATHLGLRPSERIEQARRLIDALKADATTPTVLAGDINEWALPKRALGLLHAHFGESQGRGTFPSPLPVFALDRIWIAPARALVGVRAHKSRLARIASDHLPLVADIDLP